jgi:hypothetical protein
MTVGDRGRRREDAVPRNRRIGPSRLSAWNGRQIALSWVVWPGAVVSLVAIGIAISLWLRHGLDEVRLDLSRSNLVGLLGVLFFPPACLTVLWRLMHQRRRRQR